MNVLVVDDTPFMRKVLGDIVVSDGHRVVGEAANGIEAIAMYKKLKPDAVTMDVVMPQMDGITALSRILDEDPFATVIICSALNQKTLIKKALKMGAWDYIVKPFSRERVLEVFHSLEMLRHQVDGSRESFGGILREDPESDRRVFLGV